MESLTEDTLLAPILQTKNLCHVYGEGTPFRHEALRHIDLSIDRGEFLGVIGHTGSGKSTLIQHLNGLLKPTSGEVLFDGEDIWKDKAFTRAVRFKVGLVFQYPEYQLFEETVYADIAFGPKNMGLDKDEVDRRVRRAAGFVGISEKSLQKSPFDLSGGNRRRAAIAGVIAMEPDVLILDEPTAGLDPLGSEQILQNIRDWQAAQGAAVVMVTHDMSDIAECADRIVVLSDGALAMDGTPREIFSRAQELTQIGLDVPQVTKVFLRLRELGLDVDPAVYTVQQAAQALLKRKGGSPC
ncbi:MAG: energy-coupling factor transporter ATPase [Oscillospiraceae bacterium]|nr:energy-coupling factor transporter ATPase [Oscillospiraceae bacterium]